MIPEMESRHEIATESEVEIPTDVDITVRVSDGEGWGTTRPETVVKTRICAAEMAVRYAALSACRKVHVCHCNSLGGAT